MSDQYDGGVAEAVMDAVLKHGSVGDGSTFNLGLILRYLLGVYTYLAALNPDLNTPQKVRVYCEAEAKEMRRLILSAQASHRDDGITDMLRMERVQ